MNQTGIEWSVLKDRKSAIELQQFTCTTDRPRTSRGRELKHPEHWELEAQALLRTTFQGLGSNEQVLVGRGLPTRQIDAAAWLETHAVDDIPALFIKACGVRLELRYRGGAVADELFRQILGVAKVILGASAKSRLRIHGNLHVNNSASEAFFARSGFEPVGLPAEDYQQWMRLIEHS